MTRPAETEPTLAEPAVVKPRLRGTSHKYAFFVSVVAGAMLVWMAGDTYTQLVALAYVSSLSSLLAVSALYHCVNWSPEKRRWIRRLDHTMIFVLIAGSYTPISMLVLDGALARNTMIIVWSAVGVGAVLNLVWLSAPKWVMAALCVAVGWVAVMIVPELYESHGPIFVAMLALGGILYTIGAVVYALKRPNPNPAVFGYHEIFHALVVIAAGLHFAAFAIYVFAPLG